LNGSRVLSFADPKLKSKFLSVLTADWLPGKRFEMLYRGSHDGMTPKAFHDKCDGKGPTLVLVAGQSVGQPVCVFGGYASKSWERGPEAGAVRSLNARDSFVFTVVNPFGNHAVRMPVVSGGVAASSAMICHPSLGPVFGTGKTIALTNAAGTSTHPFDESSHCNPGPEFTYGDPIGRFGASFTGSSFFLPKDVEVWAVI
jgi:hypothetical protein